MKLYLSSQSVGNHASELLKLAPRGTFCAIIPNALDSYDDETRQRNVGREVQLLRELGFNTDEIDLRNYFNKSRELEERLSKFQMVWVLGGNTFTLLAAFKFSGFDQIMKKRINEDSFVYGGYSAGAVVTGTTLRGVELVDPLSELPDSYPKPNVFWDGMGLVNYSIVPHYQTEGPEAAAIKSVITYLEQNKIDYRTLRDGEVIVINDSQLKTLAS